MLLLRWQDRPSLALPASQKVDARMGDLEEAMNEDQKAALTEREKRPQDKCACGHWWEPSHVEKGSCRDCPCVEFQQGASHTELSTALADARLELQEAKDSRDGFACDLDAAEKDIARLTQARRPARRTTKKRPVGRSL